MPILDTKTNIGDTATSTRLTMEDLVRLVNGGALVWYLRSMKCPICKQKGTSTTPINSNYWNEGCEPLFADKECYPSVIRRYEHLGNAKAKEKGNKVSSSTALHPNLVAQYKRRTQDGIAYLHRRFAESAQYRDLDISARRDSSA